jgi:hypothetical protein
MHPYIRWFDDLGLDDVPIVGGKSASLGELYRTLAAAGGRVPNDYAPSGCIRWPSSTRLDEAPRREIDRRTGGCADKPVFFVDRLAEGVVAHEGQSTERQSCRPTSIR